MARRFDRTIKRLLRRPTPTFVSWLLGRNVSVVRSLPTELVSNDSIYPDMLLELDDGAILHLEFQNRPEEDFAFRMASYFFRTREQFGKPPEQYVLWLAEGPPMISDRYQEGRGTVEYTVVNPETVDGRKLLLSGSLDEQMLGAACQIGRKTLAVRRIIGQIGKLAPTEARNALKRLSTLAELRGMEDVMLKELKRMPITYDIRDSVIFRMGTSEGIERGRQEGIEQGIEQGVEKGMHKGSVDMLLMILRERFGPIPQASLKRIRAADSKTIAKWGVAALRAKSLKEVLGPSR